MAYSAEKLMDKMIPLDTFDWDKIKKDLVDVRVKPEMFICENGLLHISGEDGKGFVDYYGEFRGGYPYIAPELEAWAKKCGGYWEWDNPASICFIEG